MTRITLPSAFAYLAIGIPDLLTDQSRLFREHTLTTWVRRLLPDNGVLIVSSPSFLSRRFKEHLHAAMTGVGSDSERVDIGCAYLGH
jgi:hypothetical protein